MELKSSIGDITMPTAMFVCNGNRSEYTDFLSKTIYYIYVDIYVDIWREIQIEESSQIL